MVYFRTCDFPVPVEPITAMIGLVGFVGAITIFRWIHLNHEVIQTKYASNIRLMNVSCCLERR